MVEIFVNIKKLGEFLGRNIILSSYLLRLHLFYQN